MLVYVLVLRIHFQFTDRVTYRPDNELCLMRNMTSPVFCPICQESIYVFIFLSKFFLLPLAIWIQFFKRISLIDNLTLVWIKKWKKLKPTLTFLKADLGNNVQVTLGVIPLGPLRPIPVPGYSFCNFYSVSNIVVGESLAVSWFKNNVEDTTLQNILQWTRPKTTAGIYLGWREKWGWDTWDLWLDNGAIPHNEMRMRRMRVREELRR